ncbi:MAG: UDP-glucose/GDP-mannose dehydrogenase family protein [Pseudomonadales bacterium]|nr:UDP-glucose/GDP-mannose dehydrogenase family protein [Pseudomonadales bacterium]MBO6595995.1 UDP-glucose/GDP-mannose dehydrogenase family protein [Pseudomonadales bacterium]MBO6822478.1 UDP-glucose/GDP-mannose dehydrogenase family protein [Pseudomonadales bacterium]
MKLAIVGTGYVGLVTGTCFAEMGNDVTCIDVDEDKLNGLRKGVIPIHEPGLDDLVASNFDAGRLTFSSDLSSAMQDAEVIFIAVGTPPNEDGSADLSYVLAVAKSIGEKLEHPIVVVDKSTVPVGTADKVREAIKTELDARGEAIEFDVISNPEFLREGSAVKDFMYPDRIVVGTNSAKSERVMEELYGAFSKKQDRIQFVGIRDAEMIKYAANAMLATKISFMNEVALMCDDFGVDVENVRRGIGSDPRIGPSFIYPGCGYGGSCFPKDVRAMINMAENAGLTDTIFDAVERRNEKQQLVLVDKIVEKFGSDLSGKTFALWGLAFKPETDDIRGAPAIAISRALCQHGAHVKAYDPQAIEASKKALEGINISFVDNPYSASDGADALIVVTEWRQFKQPDFRRLTKELKSKTVFDGRNIYNPERCADYGLTYVGIGRNSELFS